MEKKLNKLISEDDIKDKIKELAKMISEDYAGLDLMLIGILKAAWIFTADIIREINIPVTCDFIRAASYSETSGSGKVNLIWDVKSEMVAGKDVLLVDTVLDTGLTMKFIIDHINSMNPNSINICVLLNKASNRKINIQAKYTGFPIPGNFVVGYGLDMDDKYRNLSYIAILN